MAEQELQTGQQLSPQQQAYQQLRSLPSNAPARKVAYNEQEKAIARYFGINEAQASYALSSGLVQVEYDYSEGSGQPISAVRLAGQPISNPQEVQRLQDFYLQRQREAYDAQSTTYAPNIGYEFRDNAGNKLSNEQAKALIESGGSVYQKKVGQSPQTQAPSPFYGLPEGAIGSARGGGYLFPDASSPSGASVYYPVASAVGGGTIFQKQPLNTPQVSSPYGSNSVPMGGASRSPSGGTILDSSSTLSSPQVQGKSNQTGSFFEGFKKTAIEFITAPLISLGKIAYSTPTMTIFGGSAPIGSAYPAATGQNISEYNARYKATATDYLTVGTIVALPATGYAGYAAKGVVAGSFTIQSYQIVKSPTAENLGSITAAGLLFAVPFTARKVSEIKGYPKYETRYVAAETASRDVGNGVTQIIFKSKGETIQKGFFVDKKYYFAAQTDVRTSAIGDTNAIQFTAGTRGAVREFKGAEFPTTRRVYGEPQKFGSVETGVAQPKELNLFMGEQQGMRISKPIENAYEIKSAGKTTVQGQKAQSFASMGVAGDINADTAFLFARSVPTYRNAKGEIKLQSIGQGDTLGLYYKNAPKGEVVDFSGGVTTLQTRVSPEYLAKLKTQQAVETVLRQQYNAQTVRNAARIDVTTRTVRTTAGASSISSSFNAELQSVRSSFATPAQSAYYGTGQYERTSFVTASIEKQTTRMYEAEGVKFAQVQRTEFAFKAAESYKFANVQKTQELSRQDFSLKNISVQGTQQRQALRQVAIARQIQGFPASPRTPYFSSETPKFAIPKLSGFNGELGLRDFGAKRNTRYVPSFTALVFKIQGSYKAGKLSKSGLDFRPITSNFSFIRRRKG